MLTVTIQLGSCALVALWIIVRTAEKALDLNKRRGAEPAKGKQGDNTRDVTSHRVFGLEAELDLSKADEAGAYLLLTDDFPVTVQSVASESMKPGDIPQVQGDIDDSDIAALWQAVWALSPPDVSVTVESVTSEKPALPIKSQSEDAQPVKDIKGQKQDADKVATDEADKEKTDDKTDSPLVSPTSFGRMFDALWSGAKETLTIGKSKANHSKTPRSGGQTPPLRGA